jgi:hypothetical protein
MEVILLINNKLEPHWKIRGLQRYNIEFTYKDIKNITESIYYGNSIKLNIQTREDNLSFHYIKFKNIPIKVLFKDGGSLKNSKVVTLYPLEVEEANEVFEQAELNLITDYISFLESKGYKVIRL